MINCEQGERRPAQLAMVCLAALTAWRSGSDVVGAPGLLGGGRKGQVLPAFEFRLYVAGTTPRARAAVGDLRAVCLASVGDDHGIQVIDVVDQPALAEEERILATPTVLRLVPLPRLRVVGDLSDHRAVALALELPQPGNPDHGEPR